MNKLLCIILLAAFFALAGCAATDAEPEAASGAEPSEIAVLPSDPSAPAALDLSAPDSVPEGVSCENGVFTVTESGTYRVTGSAAAKLVVDADGPVELILAGVGMRSPEAICVLSSAAVTITTAAGTENTLFDGADEPDPDATAVIWSKAPLVLKGEGALTVLGGANNGIQCKSVLTVEGGTLTVRAANNGLKAEGALYVKGGSADITTGGDGLKAEAGRVGYGDISISGGAVTIAASGRGVNAEGTVSLLAGALGVRSADDAVKGAAVSVSGCAATLVSALDGIQAEDTLSISGGTLDITAGDDALRGGSVALSGGSVTLVSEGDGAQADNTLTVTGGTLDITAGDDGLRGYDVTISNGAVTLDAYADGVQAENALTVTGGSLSVVTAGGGGDAINKSGDDFGPMMWWGGNNETELDHSAKGLKSDSEIYISGGTIDLNTADDAIHAGVLVTIDGGEIAIVSSDDAIHADDLLEINDGVVSIADCFEGIEAFAIEIRGGDVSVRAVNDGINANGSEFGMMGWGRGSTEAQETEITSLSGEATTYYRQSGGTVDIVVTGNSNNVGDGIDSNGYVYIDGGVLTVSTFGNTQEGGIDTGRDGPIVTGGMVMAGGASMMQESWASGSTQCCAVVNVELQPGGTPVTIYDEAGNEIWSVTLENTFNCIVLSHPALELGHVYTVDYGGGTETLDFSASNILRVGSSSFGWGMMGGGFPGGRP